MSWNIVKIYTFALIVYLCAAMCLFNIWPFLMSSSCSLSASFSKNKKKVMSTLIKKELLRFPSFVWIGVSYDISAHPESCSRQRVWILSPLFVLLCQTSQHNVHTLTSLLNPSVLPTWGPLDKVTLLWRSNCFPREQPNAWVHSEGVPIHHLLAAALHHRKQALISGQWAESLSCVCGQEMTHSISA